MNNRKTAPALPGLAQLNGVMSAYVTAWDRYIQTVNQAWADCTCDGAAASDWPKAWGKVMQTLSDNAQDICNAYTTQAGAGAASCGSGPLLTFVIDQSASTDPGPQTVALPAGVDPAQLVATPLVSISDRATTPGNESLGNAVLALLVDGRIEVRVAVPPKPPAKGHYLSVIYESKAGNPKNIAADPSTPPPRNVIATVLVSFIPTPI